MEVADSICQQIESLREKLRKVIPGKQFTDPEVLSVSRQLDNLVNQYYFLQKGYPNGNNRAV